MSCFLSYQLSGNFSALLVVHFLLLTRLHILILTPLQIVAPAKASPTVLRPPTVIRPLTVLCEQTAPSASLRKEHLTPLPSITMAGHRRPTKSQSTRLVSSLSSSFLAFVALILLCPVPVRAENDTKQYGTVIGIGMCFRGMHVVTWNN